MAAAAAGAGAEAETFIPVCDELGYINQANTCWSDTMQELFFFSDPIKTLSQKKAFEFLEMIDDGRLQIKISEFIKSRHDEIISLKHNMGKNITIENFNNSFYIFVTNILKRFANHYNYIKKLPFKYDEACALPLRVLAKKSQNSRSLLKRSLSEIHGLEAGKSISTLYRNAHVKENGSVSHGLDYERYKFIYKLLFNLFEIEYEIGDDYDFSHLSGEVIHIFTLEKYNKAVREYKKIADSGTKKEIESKLEEAKQFKNYKSRHSCGILKCNEKWLYYDSNFGLYPLPSAMTLKEISEMTGVFYVNGLKNILPFKGLEFEQFPKQVWFEDTWVDWGELVSAASSVQSRLGLDIVGVNYPSAAANASAPSAAANASAPSAAANEGERINHTRDDYITFLKQFYNFIFSVSFKSDKELISRAFPIDKPSKYCYVIEKRADFKIKPTVSKGGARKTRRYKNQRKTRRLRKLK